MDWFSQGRARGCTGIIALIILLIGSQTAITAPFARKFSCIQPGGAAIELWGRGDDFYATFETLDGYSVVYVPEQRTYYYAQLSPDQNDLMSSGLVVGQDDPRRLNLVPHLRINAGAAQSKATARFSQWNESLQITSRWKDLKKARRDAEQNPAGDFALATLPNPTRGTKVGLCLLVDFDSDVATVPPEEISNFCNADSYTGFGNNGSVKKYFQDNSNGQFTYSNVVTAFIRIPSSLHPKSYYNDTSQSCFLQGNLLIRDAISVMKSLTNYESEILPMFDAVSVNTSNTVIALNVVYAGDNGGVWAYGLWPHSGGLTNVGAQELSAGGKKVFRYHMVNLGDSLEMGLFCHENGHLLFGYPDLYDYDFDSSGGAGRFCIMNDGWPGPNPSQICAYLKHISGWDTLTDLTSASSVIAEVTATAGPNFNHFYRYQRPGVPTEYFLVENRQQQDRDATLPASGVAIWHVDELGDHNNQSLLTNSIHANYEVTLMQADNQWDFEDNANNGDPFDLYYAGNTAAAYSDSFSDASAPSAQWWDGTSSGLNFHTFSASETTMTFIAEPSLSITSQPLSQIAILGSNTVLRVGVSSTLPVRYQWFFNNSPLVNQTNAVLLLVNARKTNAGSYFALAANKFITNTSSSASLSVAARPTLMVSSISNHTFRAVLEGEFGAKYEIEISSNLQSWTSFLLLTNGKGQIAFSQTNISNVPSRFFRARFVP